MNEAVATKPQVQIQHVECVVVDAAVDSQTNANANTRSLGRDKVAERPDLRYVHDAPAVVEDSALVSHVCAHDAHRSPAGVAVVRCYAIATCFASHIPRVAVAGAGRRTLAAGGTCDQRAMAIGQMKNWRCWAAAAAAVADSDGQTFYNN